MALGIGGVLGIVFGISVGQANAGEVFLGGHIRPQPREELGIAVLRDQSVIDAVLIIEGV